MPNALPHRVVKVAHGRDFTAQYRRSAQYCGYRPGLEVHTLIRRLPKTRQLYASLYAFTTAAPATPTRKEQQAVAPVEVEVFQHFVPGIDDG